MRVSLAEIFKSTDHPYDAVHDLVSKAIKSLSKHPVLVTRNHGAMAVIDLKGESFVLDRPLEIQNAQLIKICNGTLITGPDFPVNEYLIRVYNVYGVTFSDLFLECSKCSNGIRLEKFLRVRVEDCHIVHQRKFGIYSTPTGGNHELEIMKCHISEFVFGDGHPKKKINYGVIPEFDIDAHRVSTGIFLGQADNVVSDCNINLCRVGIFSGMRANRIYGNHITGGGSKGLELFKGIELNNHGKSSALIVNNYIDNCCLWINCNSNPKKNLRNYIHVTDNLFYRGYNHPIDGGEFHHIVINPLEENSLIGNLHICDNKFYNQPENLEGIKPRVIRPVLISATPTIQSTEALANAPEVSLDHAKLIGVTMKNNYFTNCFPTYVVPMGSVVTKVVQIVPERQTYTVDFGHAMPLGYIQTAEASILKYSGEVAPVATIRRIRKRTVIVDVRSPCQGSFSVTASTETAYNSRYNYIVH